MPDQRSHRGPHPEDAELFGPPTWPALRAAVGDLAWLLGRGYAEPSALKIVGDRYGLTVRQRTAVMRCTCSDAALAIRGARRIEPSAAAGQTILIDGYNVLTTVEAALGGAAIFLARDQTARDMVSMHGTWRKVAETAPALRLIGRTLAEMGVAGCRWYLDQPVSNSGRLIQLVRQVAAEAAWPWEAELVPNPDVILRSAEEIVATADSAILDRCQRWLNLAREVVRRQVPEARWVDLSISS